MWKVTYKGLLANKLRFLLTGLAVTLGVAFMSGTMVLTDTLGSVFNHLLEETEAGTDAVVRGRAQIETDLDHAERPPVSGDVLRSVRTVDGVDHADGSVQINQAQMVDENGKAIGNPCNGPPTLGFSWSDDPDLSPMTLLPDGRAPRSDDEIIVDRGSAKRAKLAPGDRVSVLTQRGASDYTVVGIARFGSADDLAGASLVFFTTDEAMRINGYDDEYDEIDVAASEGVSRPQLVANIRETLRSQYGTRRIEVLTGDAIIEESKDQVAEGLGFLSTALLVFAGVALFVGSFIIYNTFTIIVAQRTREMALLRALGASRHQIMTSVTAEASLIGLGASALGIGAGIALASFLEWLLKALGLGIPSASPVVETSTIVTSLVVGTVVTVISAVLPARKASRVPPVAAMRAVAVEPTTQQPSRVVAGGAVTGLGTVVLLFGLLGGPDNAIAYIGGGAFMVLIGVFLLSPLVARPVSRFIGAPLPRLRGMAGTLARENAMRNPQRTAITASALMIGVALVGFITIFASSAKASVAATIESQIKADYVVSTCAGGFRGGGLSPTVAEHIKELPEVGASTGLRLGPMKVGEDSAFAIAADPTVSDRLFDFNIREGSLSTLGADGLAVSRRKADENDWSLGDRVRLTFALTGKQRFTVEAIFDSTDAVGNYLISMAGYEENFKDQLDTQIFVKLADGVTPERGRAAIEPLLTDYPNAQVQDQAEFLRSQSAQIDQMVNLIYALLALAVVIALMGIANTLALSIHERTREIGLLRAVGMSRSQVRTTVRWEAVIISLFGTVLGIVVGLFFGYVVFLGLHDEGFTKLDVAPSQLLLVVLLGALAGIVAAVGPARRAAKLEVLDAIAFE